MTRTLAVALCTLLSACISPGSYQCATDTECGEGGSCEASGYCGFADQSCADGRRYGDHAADLAGSCVVVDPPVGPQILTVVAGAGHNCAVRDDGEVFCWGGNRAGSLGDGTREQREEPVQPRELPPIHSLAAGSVHVCALDRDGGVWCWGGGKYGQIGVGDQEDQDLPVSVPGLANVIAVAAGDHHACALGQGGQVYCWGRNEVGQLGLGTISGDDDDPGGVAEPKALAIDDAIELVADGDTSCARRAGGGVVCWGSNENGQLGLGDIEDRHLPVAIPWLAGAVGIAVGGRHLCALSLSGSLSCAGDNRFGQLGDRSKKERHAPVDVAGLTGMVQVSAGRGFSCARGGQELICWGRNGSGELGAGAGNDRNTPGAGVSIPGAVIGQVSAGNEHACALASDGCVWCWGDDELGQLGNGSASGREPGPVGQLCEQSEF